MQAQLTFCGHSAFILTTEQKKRIAIDPYLKGNPTCPPELVDPGPVDGIVVTHGHSDHVGSTVELAKKYGAKVFAPYELGTFLHRQGVPKEQLEFMNKGGSVKFGDLRVTLTNANHSSAAESGEDVIYTGEPCGVVITLESGRTVYHAGDTCFFGDMKFIGEFYKPVVAMLPIGDRYTMGPGEAAFAAQVLNAKFAIPIHYATFPLLSGTPDEFASLLEGTKCTPVVLQPGKSLEF